MIRLVLASANAAKFAEFTHLFSNLEATVISQTSLGIKPVAEVGLSFIENAIAKARHAAAASGLPAVADDSGLVVRALGGAPGIYSSRYAGVKTSERDNNLKLLRELNGISDRAAEFYCALAYLRSDEDPVPIVATGYWHGEILSAPRGRGGFGYDPLFLIPALQKTAAELSQTEKNNISHRARAGRSLLAQLQRQDV